MSEGSGGVPSFPPLPPKTDHDPVAAREGGMRASVEKSFVDQVRATPQKAPQGKGPVACSHHCCHG